MDTVKKPEFITLPDGRVEQILRPHDVVVYVRPFLTLKQEPKK